MLFNSLEFVLYLPLVFCLYWFVFKPVRVQNAFVVVCSYLFYGWWDWRFLLLIAFTTLCSYVSGRLMEHVTFRRTVCLLNVVLNLGILFLFKYYNFFAESLASLLTAVGIGADEVTLRLILPVGISFYTFQAIGYTVDVYRREIPAAKDVTAFFAFISFFPQLVAGPIERASRLYPQFLRQRVFDEGEALSGCRLILWGFFKKIVVADGAAGVVNEVFGQLSSCNATTLWIGALLFTFQIYGDFSGYSDIAIGTARLFGIRLTANFCRPYLSGSIPEFWRRWHISLNSWFRDYLYIPLGGNRTSRLRVLRNTLVVFLASGLWHGANWTFVVWGLYHALFFIPRLFRKTSSGAGRPSFPAWCVTFVAVMVGWVIFRAPDLQSAFSYLQGMLTAGWGQPGLGDVHVRAGLECLVAIGVLMTVEYLGEKGSRLCVRWSMLRGIRWVSYAMMAVWTVLFYSVGQSFIYFQF